MKEVLETRIRRWIGRSRGRGDERDAPAKSSGVREGERWKPNHRPGDS